MFVNLSALFLSLKRLSEVLPPHVFFSAGGSQHIAQVSNDEMRRLRLRIGIESASIEWLNESDIQTLGEQLVSHSLAEGSFFTHYGPFFGKDILAAVSRYHLGKPLKVEAQIRVKLDAFVEGASLTIQVHPENYTTSSTAGELAGKKRLFVVGRVTDTQLPAMRAQAYLIGHLHQEYRYHDEGPLERTGRLRDPFERLPFQMEVYLANVTPFDEALNEPRASTTELTKLQNLLEHDVKGAFAEIIGESFVPNDSPAETSDLQTTHLKLNGQQVSAAFTFKGRGLKSPLTPGNFGTGGTQLSKLFSEPVDLLIVQHCNKVTSPVRDHMRAFATRIHNLRPFMIIDGNDTVRILRHFRKLSFGK